MKITRILAFILAAIICISAFASCEKKEGDQTESASGTEAATNSSSNNSTGKDEEVKRFDYFGAKLSDYIKVDKSLYTNLSATVSAEYKVDDALLDKYIKSLQYKHRTKTNEDTKVRDSAIKFGDSVFIYYKGIKDGKEFEGGSNWSDSEPFELGIGSGNFIPGFEDGLIGLIPSETSKEKPFELHVTFPESYSSSDLAGQAVIFQVYVEYTVQYTIPEYNESFITDTLKFDAETDDVMAEHNEFALSLLKDEADYYAKMEALDHIWEELLEKATVIKYAEGEVDYYYQSYLDQYEYYKEYYSYMGYKFDTLDEFVIAYLGLEEGADWKAETRVTAELDTKQNMIFHAIAQQENIVITDANYNNAIQYYINYYKNSYNQTYTAAQIEEMVGDRMIKEYALFEKVNNLLFENCKISYAEK